jgi:hypothetical protein
VRRTTCAVIAFQVLSFAVLARAQEAVPADAATPSAWTMFVLEAHKGLLKARVELTVTRSDAASVATAIVPCSDGVGRIPESGPAVILDAVTDAPFRAKQKSRTWIGPDGGVLQSESWEGKTHRRARICPAGRHSWKWERKGKDDEELVRDRDQPRPSDARPYPVVDATSLVWLVSERGLAKEEGHLDVATWSKTGLVTLRCDSKESGLVPGRGDHPGVRGRRIEINAVDEEDDGSEPPATLFGLVGPVNLWLAEDTGLPLVLEGQAKKVGRIRAVNVAAGVR